MYACVRLQVQVQCYFVRRCAASTGEVHLERLESLLLQLLPLPRVLRLSFGKRLTSQHVGAQVSVCYGMPVDVCEREGGKGKMGESVRAWLTYRLCHCPLP